MTDLLRFSDLKARGIVRNRTTLGRWVQKLNFPPGMKMGIRTRVWDEAEIEAWIAERRRVTGQTEAKAKRKREAAGLPMGNPFARRTA